MECECDQKCSIPIHVALATVEQWNFIFAVGFQTLGSGSGIFPKSIPTFYGENGSMFGVGEVMVMLVIRTHLAGDTSPEQSNCQ